MTSKELIKQVINYDHPARIGYDFTSEKYPSDIVKFDPVPSEGEDLSWHDAKDYRDKFPVLKNFDGTVRFDEFGNLWGRMRSDLYGIGESLQGALYDWDALNTYTFPAFSDFSRVSPLKPEIEKVQDKYLVGVLPGFPFSIMRVLRNLDNFLMDVMLEPEKVSDLMEIVLRELEGLIVNFSKIGMDAVMAYEDWGIQDRLLINPEIWRELFKPAFVRLCKKAHACGMHIILHSCGYIYDVLEDMMMTGIDVFQLDQPTLMGEERIAELFKKHKKTLYSPVDIQKVLPTGNRKLIEEEAKRMINLFSCGGGFIAEDYGDYSTIMVKEEWADWARDIFTGRSSQ